MASIPELKERQILDTPLLLFDCELSSGAVHSWSTHAVRFEGREYLARVLRHNVFEMHAGSEEGIDAISKITISLANADSYFSQVERSAGWKGARLTVRFVFFDLKSRAAASEATVVFRGVANPPEEITETVLRLSFINRLSLQRTFLPDVRIQRRCPWTFPTTSEQRQEAVRGGTKGRYSPFFRCGYSAGMAEGVGNLNNGSPYHWCDYTRQSCEQRGMFDRDAAGNDTRRFGGIEFVPPAVAVRSYGERGVHLSTLTENLARYNDFVPLVYGTAWHQPPIVFARNDGNLTRMEVLLGAGEIEGVLKVVVNGIEIPEGRAGAEMTATGWYNVVSLGGRTGGFNLDFADKGGRPLGDPYGSMAYMSVVVPNRISDGRALPRVEALVRGLKLEIFDQDGVYSGYQFTNNPAWIILDLLRRCGWEVGEIDLKSFARTAAHCDELIDVEDLYGSVRQVPRYQCNLVVRKRRSAADLVRGVRNAAGLYLTYGPGGVLELHPEGGFALQHPVKPAGSNSVEPFNGGWPCYEFGDGTSAFSGILRRANGEPALRLWSRANAETANRYSVEFQNEFNEYQQDSLSLVDVDDVLATGQEVSATLHALGIPNVSQAARMIRRQLDKDLRGNLFVEFETSVRGLGLKPGDLITLTYRKEGLVRQPFRILKVAIGANYRTLALTCQKHEDGWYEDRAVAGGEGEGRQPGSEVGLPRPLIGKILDEDGEPQFEVVEKAAGNNDGGVRLTLSVGFVPPAKPEISRAGMPLLSLAPRIERGGGVLTGGQTLYYAVSGADASGAEGPLSFTVRAAIPSGGSNYSVTLRGLSFSRETASFHVYRGNSPSTLYRIASGVARASEFRDTGLPTVLAGPPDENYDHARFYWRLELLPEQAVSSATENTIGSATLAMLANEYAGMTVRITRGKGAGQERPVLSNDAQTLVVAPGWSVVPDGSSRFVVAESSWHFGAAGMTSPVEFEVPNREGATVHISGRATNVHGRECAYELSPLTRWVIGGASGSVGVDNDVPARPVFGLIPTGQGTVELVSVGFSDLANTRNVQAGTLTLHYWNELEAPTLLTLTAGLAESDTVIQLSTPPGWTEGSVVQIGPEIMVVDTVLAGGVQFEVSRGAFGTTPRAHPSGSAVYGLARKVYVVPFVKNFFGSPASGSFAYPIFIPDVRIAAAELYVTNTRGDSETARVSFTETAHQGLRTLSGGQLSIQVEGYLAIQANAAPPLVIEEAHSVRDIFAVVGQAPTGAPVQLQLRQGGQPYCALTIPAGSTVSNVVDGFGLPPLRERAELTLDIVSVGYGDGMTPGADLTVTIRL